MSLANLAAPFLREAAEQQHNQLVSARGADPALSTGPNARFIGRIEFDGQTHYYDCRTSLCERRRGSHNIPSGRRPGWIVSKPFNGNGRNGCYARLDAFVIRPKSKAELAADAGRREDRRAKLLAKRALPFTVRLLLAHSGYSGRKQVLRTDAAWAERLLPGFTYECEWFALAKYAPKEATYWLDNNGNWTQGLSRREARHFSRLAAEQAALDMPGVVVCNGYDLSPYGPRTRNLLTRLGLPVEQHNHVLTVCGFTV